MLDKLKELAERPINTAVTPASLVDGYGEGITTKALFLEYAIRWQGVDEYPDAEDRISALWVKHGEPVWVEPGEPVNVIGRIKGVQLAHVVELSKTNRPHWDALCEFLKSADKFDRIPCELHPFIARIFGGEKRPKAQAIAELRNESIAAMLGILVNDYGLNRTRDKTGEMSGSASDIVAKVTGVSPVSVMNIRSSQFHF